MNQKTKEVRKIQGVVKLVIELEKPPWYGALVILMASDRSIQLVFIPASRLNNKCYGYVYPDDDLSNHYKVDIFRLRKVYDNQPTEFTLQSIESDSTTHTNTHQLDYAPHQLDYAHIATHMRLIQDAGVGASETCEYENTGNWMAKLRRQLFLFFSSL